MANSVIQIKQSFANAAPISLNVGEPAYSYVSNTLFIGTPDNAGYIEIGGFSKLLRLDEAFIRANSGFIQANASFLHANAAYQSQNATGQYANASYNHANSAFIKANSSYESQNATGQYANAAFTVANGAFFHANAAFANANGAFAAANAAYIQANAVFSNANSYITNNEGVNVRQNNNIIVALNSANAAHSNANGAFAAANAAYIQANSGFIKTNSAFGHANAAYQSQNATGQYANSAFIQANSAFGHVNSAFGHANAAFTRANNSLSANVGGTVTGDVRITGNLFVTGNTTYVNTSQVLIADNIITLNAALNQASSPTLDAGIEIDRGSSANVFVLWNETIDKWTVTNDGTNYYGIGSDAAEAYANSGFIQANAAFNHANASYAAANNVFPQIQPAYNTANAAFIQANSAYESQNATGQYANSAFIKANSAYESQNATGQYANSAFIKSNSAFGHANAAYTSQNATGQYANSAFVHANSAYNSQNATGQYANSAFVHANSAFIHANSAYNSQNATGQYANSAFIRANNSLNANVGGNVTGEVVIVGNLTSNTITTTGSNGSISGANAIFTNYIFAANGNVDLYIYSSNAYANANGAFAAANAAFANANGGFAKANAAFANANGAFAAANAAYIHANSGFIQANAGFFQANAAFANANGAFAAANAAYIQANSGFIQANASFNHANAAFANANGAFAAANAAYIQANSGFFQANAAFANANGAFAAANAAYNQSNSAFIHANSAYATANFKTETFVQDTAPASANVDDIWIDSTSGIQYVYINSNSSNQWVEFSAYSSPLNGTANIQFADQTIFTVNSAQDLIISNPSAANIKLISGNTVITGNLIADAPGKTALFNNITAVYFRVNTQTIIANSAAVNIVGSTGYYTQIPTSNGYMLQITGADNSTSRVVNDSAGVGSYSAFIGRHARGNHQNPTAAQANDLLARFSGNGYGVTGYGVNAGGSSMDVYATENYTDTSRGSKLVFSTTANGTNARTVSATIDANTTTFAGTVAPQKGFIYPVRKANVANSVAVTIDFANDAIVRCTVNADMTVYFTNYTTGKIVDLWVTNLSGTNKTITHGVSATNSTDNDVDKTIPGTSTAKFQYYSIDGDLANTFVAITQG